MTRHLSAAVLLTAAAILGGCAASKPKDITADWSPNRIYQEAKDEESAGQMLLVGQDDYEYRYVVMPMRI